MMQVFRLAVSLEVELDSEAETSRLGEAIARVVSASVVIGLVGSLGAGKTRLSRGIAEALGVDPGAISSPTFVLIHEYEGRLPVYHFDAYRLREAREFEELGVTDYWQAGGVCLVEWADRVRESMPAETWWIRILPTGETQRSLRIDFPDGQEGTVTELEQLLDPARPRT